MASEPGREVATLDSTVAGSFPQNLDEMRVLARERFKERIAHGGLGSGCECHDTPVSGVAPVQGDDLMPCVVGVRFIDSGQVYYYDAGRTNLALNDWVVVDTSRGKEAAKVVIAPSNVALSQIKGELKPVDRVMDDEDIAMMDRMRRESANAVRVFSTRIRHHRLPMKPISAEYAFDGSLVTLSFSTADKVDYRELARDMASQLRCRVELRQVGQRDEARLLGGVGRCGRTLCCSTWLPMFPEVNMGMAKVQDLSLNPGKVSGVCGRLLCCLSYENEQYRQMKAIMPKLGQTVQTPRGDGTVISLQILKDLVTVRLEGEAVDVQYTAVELGIDDPRMKRHRIVAAPVEEAAVNPTEVPETAPVAAQLEPGDGDAGESEATGAEPGGRGRKRRRRRNRGGPKKTE